jgi:formate hydrogenlyase subunit 3/multisubunit Na+/H+ antiporter MnhD subunit
MLVVSMTGVVLARDGVLFLFAWEIMSISGFFLVTFDNERDEVQRAGIAYLVASQIGVVFLFVLFGLFARHAGDFGFASIGAAGSLGPELANACFLLALVGFGSKAGFWILHTWLPEAHPAAPSHVSATMSGVMIKMGIYGVLRVVTLLGPPPVWWGIVLIAIGASSGLLGVLHALAQRDLKRLLAYSSVENVGIITLAMGLGLLGQSTSNPAMAFLGYSGAIVHTLNHSLFKGLLFFGAGSVLHATGTRQMDALGGLARKMPITTLTWLVGSVAIVGLPPLNGFIGEWLIYVAAFRGGASLEDSAVVAALAVIPALALIGGLGAACFIRAFGIVFLGEPRSSACDAAHDPPVAMRVPMIVAAALCIGIGIVPDAALRLVERPAQIMVGTSVLADPIVGAAVSITQIVVVLLVLVGLLALLRWWLLRRREVAIGSTWSCGYEAPATRMQYTAVSFAEPALGPFREVFHRKVQEALPSGYFPRQAHHEDHPGDLVEMRVITPAVRRVVVALGYLRVLQQGRVQLYLGYILVTVILVLVWQLSGGGQ